MKHLQLNKVCFYFVIGILIFFPVTSKAECFGQCANANTFLTVEDVTTVINQAVNEAKARNTAATIAVTDRVGNVLAVYQMEGASLTVDTPVNPTTGLNAINGVVFSSYATIAKAITGAYLSSEGNAFSTRTASQIIQQHFNPGEIGQPGGPLFGVQFSSLPCSDLSTRFTSGTDVGPKRSPLGLSADPGGFPLYKSGTPVGGIGVIADGIYSLDSIVSDIDSSIDELIALAGTQGFTPPNNHLASQITVEGKTLRYSDAKRRALKTSPITSFKDLNIEDGTLQTVRGYSKALILPGIAFGEPGSGIRPAQNNFQSLDAFVLVDNNNQERFPPIAGNTLTQQEVVSILRNALQVANRTRAQIRKPFDSQARVTISLVDTDGKVLGIVRTRDAPVFGTDVSLQKARTAAFFSSATFPQKIINATDAFYLGGETPRVFSLKSYIDEAIKLFDNDPNLRAGQFAFSDRAGGNLSRPFFPDGISGRHGPFSKPIDEWNPLSTGLQLDLVINGILNHIGFGWNMLPDVGLNCTAVPDSTLNSIASFFAIDNLKIGSPLPEIPNGIQIFPGSVPVFKGNQLAGGLGVSGDGVDQDDLIAFLGLHQAGQATTTVNNAPPDKRADQLTPQGVRLRYVQCPFKPFLDSGVQDACSGK